MVILESLLNVLSLVLRLYTFVIFAAVILSWLIAFNVVNRHNDVVRSAWNFVTALTEPLLRPIRAFVPNLGGIDISPLILLIAIYFLSSVLDGYRYQVAF
jgi:YggT family protein